MGLYAGFIGNQTSGLTKPLTIGEWDGVIDGNGNFVDISGENLIYRQDIANWTITGVTASDNQINPRGGLYNAASLVTPIVGSSQHCLSISTTVTSGYTYTVSTDIKYNGCQYVAFGVEGFSPVAFGIFDVLHGDIYRTYPATGVTATIIPLGGGWFNITVQALSNVTGSTNYVPIYYLRSNPAVGAGNYAETWTATGSEKLLVANPQVVDNTDQIIKGAGRIVPVVATITKPRLDLTPYGTPITGFSHLEYQGNRIRARALNGIDQYYSRPHHSCMNIFDSDFSLTTVIKTDTSGLHALLAHTDLVSGMVLYQNGVNGYVRFYKADGSYIQATNGGIILGVYNTVQVVRSNNYVSIWVNGISANDPVSVAGYGLDGSADLSLCRFGTYYHEGSVVYTRLDAYALPDQQRVNDHEVIRGLGCSVKGSTPWTFTRSTIAYRRISDGGIFNTPPSVPRVGGEGGGLLIEPAATNYALQSQDLATTWTQVALTSVSSNAFTAPDDTQTMDGVVATADDTQHGVSQAITHTAVPWYWSAYVSKGDKDWVYMADATLANCYAYFDIAMGRVGTKGANCTEATIETNGFYNGVPCYRVQINYIGTVAVHTMQAFSALADGDNDFVGDGVTNNSYFWQLQCGQGVKARTSIPTTTVPLTRTVDSLSMPAVAFLPPLFDPVFNSKLTIEFDAQIYSNNDTIGSVRPIYIAETATKNCLMLYKVNGGLNLVWDVFFNDSTEISCSCAPPANLIDWHHYKLFLDLAVLTRSYIQIDKGASSASFASGTTQTLNLTSAIATFTQYGTLGYTEGFKIRDLHIDAKEW